MAITDENFHISIGQQSKNMSEQSYLSKEPKDVAAISHAVDMLAKGQ